MNPKGMKELIALERQLESKVENERKQLGKAQMQYNCYIVKMDSHRSLVEQYESSTDVGIEISNLEKETQSLSEEVSRLRDGHNQNVMGISEEYDILLTEITHLKQTKHDCQHDVEQRTDQMTSETERQAQLQKDIHLLQKRNHAQLTRLQRQLQEALGRSRHWNEEACKLETSIAQIRDKLEE
ncbi:hypothetical protein QZH41_020117 [Actinostola sp. cb2023]|nr:hypothetical protein QZH41_020117 [Actinostola sp. cb2023]